MECNCSDLGISFLFVSCKAQRSHNVKNPVFFVTSSWVVSIEVRLGQFLDVGLTFCSEL